MQKDVIVVKPWPYSTRMLTAGDRLTVSGPMARILVATGRARHAGPLRAAKPQPTPASAAPAAKPRRRRTKKTA